MQELQRPEPFSYLVDQIVSVRRTDGTIEPNWKVVSVTGEQALLIRPKSPAEMQAYPGGTPNMLRNTNIRVDLLPFNRHLSPPPAQSIEAQVDPFARLREQLKLRPDTRMVRGADVFGQSVTLQVTRTKGKVPSEGYPYACVLDGRGKVTGVVINYAGTTDVKLVPINKLRQENPRVDSFVTPYEQRYRQPGQASTSLGGKLKSLLGL